MSQPDIHIEVYGKTDVGLVREHNEDSFLVADVSQGICDMDVKDLLQMELGPKGALFLVCDGMGGAAAGEVASRMAVESIFEVLNHSEPRERDAFARTTRRAVEVANQRIFAQSRDNQSERGMGTTCTVAALVDEVLVVGQIGDSRCYVFREGRLAQVTKDQSLAWQLIEAGAMTPEEAKAFEHANIILQALGVQEHVEVVLSQVSLRRGDVILLCSDGLHGPVNDDEMLEILRGEPDLKKATENLLQKALERDGPDNVTVVLARFDGEGLRAPTPEDIVGFTGYDPGRDTEDDLPPIVEGEIGAVPSAAAVPQQTEELPHSGGSSLLGQSGPFSGGVLGERRGRSLVGWFLLVLLAAAAGGVFVLRCEHDQSDPAPRSAGP